MNGNLLQSNNAVRFRKRSSSRGGPRTPQFNASGNGDVQDMRYGRLTTTDVGHNYLSPNTNYVSAKTSSAKTNSAKLSTAKSVSNITAKCGFIAGFYAKDVLKSPPAFG